MSIQIRQRTSSGAYELRIKHKLLGKPLYFTFSSAEEARRYGAAVDGTLARGIVPAALLPAPDRQFSDVARVIDSYSRANAISPSTSALLATIARDIGATRLNQIDYAWAENWVQTQKLQFLRSPTTIRHHVGALARCLDWLRMRHPACLADNPLRRLPRGYSVFNKFERDTLALQGLEAKENHERDRRLSPEEEQRCVDVLRARIAPAETEGDRALNEGLLLMFQLALETAMRMRELYTLEWSQIDIARRTIFLMRTKNGDSREVPLSSVACQLLVGPWPALARCKEAGRLLPFWQGVTYDTGELDKVSRRVSSLFSEVFEAAGCPDFVFHDTRHEATCRLVLRTSLSSIEISRVTGHKDLRMLRRYMSLRGSELASKLW